MVLITGLLSIIPVTTRMLAWFTTGIALTSLSYTVKRSVSTSGMVSMSINFSCRKVGGLRFIKLGPMTIVHGSHTEYERL